MGILKKKMQYEEKDLQKEKSIIVVRIKYINKKDRETNKTKVEDEPDENQLL